MGLQEHRGRRPRWRRLPLLRVLARLCAHQARERSQVEGWRRAPVHRPRRRVQEDARVGRHRGLYRGFVISFVGIFVYRGFYFGLYDTIMPMFPPEATNLAVRFAVGYVVTVVAGLASYPIDTIRRRMMMTSGTGVNYSGSLDCAAQIMKNEGIASFFKGAGANILRGVAGAGVLAGFDTVKEAYVTYKYGPNATLK